MIRLFTRFFVITVFIFFHQALRAQDHKKKFFGFSSLSDTVIVEKEGLLPVHFLMSPIHGAIINWFAHKYGYRNFPVGDTSRNFLPVDFLMMGESYHNNHHKYGSRANFGGIRWHEIDPTYIVIKVLDKLRIIRIVKQKEIKLENVQKAA